MMRLTYLQAAAESARRFFSRRLAAVLLVATILLGTSTPVYAQREDPNAAYEDVDGRIVGYPEENILEPASPALTYMLLIGLSVLALGVMFKNARRTHLD